MACNDQISTQDTIDAKDDVIFIGEISTSRSGAVSAGAPITTATNRFGEVTDTVQGRLNKLGVIYSDPIKDWSASLVVDQLEAHRYPATTGDIYIPTAPLPFTTGATFDTSRWTLLNGYSDEQINKTIGERADEDTGHGYLSAIFASGNSIKVGVIEVGEVIDNLTHLTLKDSDGVSYWATNGETGTVSGDFNKSTGLDSGLSGPLYQVDFDYFKSIFPAMANSEGRKIEIIGTVIRQDDTTGQWFIIEDEDHLNSVPDGTIVVTAESGDDTVTLRLGKTYNRIVSAAVVVDETLAQMGVTCGGSIDNQDAVVKFSKNKLSKADMYYNGTSWVIANESAGGGTMSQNVTSVAASSGNKFTITHDNFYGSNITVTPYNRTADGATIPRTVYYAGGNGSTETYIKFLNDAGTNTLGAADARCLARVQWYNGKVVTNTLDDKLYQGNVWIILLMEV